MSGRKSEVESNSPMESKLESLPVPPLARAMAVLTNRNNQASHHTAAVPIRHQSHIQTIL
jgi:hypothetical protein